MKGKFVYITGGFLLLVLLGVSVLVEWSVIPVTLRVDGTDYPYRTSARTAADILREAGISTLPQDVLSPGMNERITRGEVITLERARWVQFWQEDALVTEILSASRLPGELLLQAGLSLGAADALLLDGAEISLTAELPRRAQYVFQIQRAVKMTITLDGKAIPLTTRTDTIAEALSEAGIPLRSADFVSVPLSARPVPGMEVSVRSARLLTVNADGGTLTGWSSAETVGEALADLGLALQALDESQPAPESALPQDGILTVRRVREEIVLEQSYLPYGSDLQAAPELPLDSREVIVPGQTGIEVIRTRVRLVDGAETSRVEEARWTAAAAQNEVLGYGQTVEINTLDTEYGALEYYRAADVYANSYRPCAFSDGCHYTTRGGCPLQKGVIAVSSAWYSWFAGAQVYIPGYGKAVVCDSGGGIPGRYWIDLGYSDDDYVGWYHWTKLYFLTPVPQNIPWILP